VLYEGSVRAVVELASFSAFSATHQTFLDQLTESIGLVLNTIEGDTLTKNLLEQSLSLAEELRAQQEELRASNEDLGTQARLLAEQNIVAEQKNQEVEESKRLVEEKAGQLAVSSRYKSEFIANMSHELRTPLNSLLILAEQLEDNPENNMTATQVEYASVIRASGNDLLSLLNDILDLAKVESGTVSVEVSSLALDMLRGSLVREFEPVAHAQGLDFTVDIAPECPETILTDPQRLRQVLKNVLTNAFKFTPRGEAGVRLSVEASGWNRELTSLTEAECVLAISVVDTGVGINEEQQQRIFDAFAQGDGTTARLYGGTGLGLSISRELVGLLGGEITVVSTPGVGSTFTVYLPAAARRNPVPVRANGALAIGERSGGSAVTREWVPQHLDPRPDSRYEDSVADPILEGVTVLVVDDDYRNVFALTALLERAHAVVTSAENGFEALAVLERSPDIGIVLMDIMMPVMDGYETIRAIRALEVFNSLPIVAVTGKVVVGERERCIEAGANDYVPKPINTAELLAALRPWLPAAALSSR